MFCSETRKRQRAEFDNAASQTMIIGSAINSDNVSLENDNATLKEQVREQFRTIEDMQRELAGLKHGQMFRTKGIITSATQRDIETQCRRLRKALDTWANGPSLKFTQTMDVSHIDTAEAFRRNLEDVSSGGMTTSKLAGMRIPMPDLIIAVASNILFRDIVSRPTASCTNAFKSEFNTTLSQYLLNNNHKVAQIWSAAALEAYESLGTWPPYFASPNEKARTREEVIEGVCDTIMDIIAPLGENVAVGEFSEDSVRNSLREVAYKALNLAITLGQLKSGQRMLDREWILDPRSELYDGDERVHFEDTASNISAASLGNPDVDFIVLLPGLLKYGDDNGDNFTSWSTFDPIRIREYSPRTSSAAANGALGGGSCTASR
ncbi:hypothetical protein B0T24DRAFT_686620 [Lasiosphaeria ovina]|uniref:Uncharacterized protein n=1 Tax=Lasiosphaeria ovina TaxID=92902 RepID=A0AAE0TWV9_9PEZI|nr:hypothetical protein B0T24DRAFT_686620 [Lasiosphaeria ovina]